ncbi:MAG: QueT transporter family protein [Acutalibacteraceae bacterium]
MKRKTVYVVQGAIIGALYIVLTIGQNLLIPGSTSAAVQFRVSEVLCLLALYTPAAIPGLTIGCLLSNILAGLGAVDLVFGPIASFFAAFFVYFFRNKCVFSLPLLSLAMPALWNGFIVGGEIAIWFSGGFTFYAWLISGGCVALGEIAVCTILGIPFIKITEKTPLKKYLTL